MTLFDDLHDHGSHRLFVLRAEARAVRALLGWAVMSFSTFGVLTLLAVTA